MALDVYLQPRHEIRRDGDFEIVAGFEDDGYYWFLLPLFEHLKRRTGQYIDLYGDAAFSGPDLEELAATLAAAARLVQSQPQQWEVSIGIQIAPVQREIFSTVRRDLFEKLLLDLEAAVEKARAQNLCITFRGD